MLKDISRRGEGKRRNVSVFCQRELVSRRTLKGLAAADNYRKTARLSAISPSGVLGEMLEKQLLNEQHHGLYADGVNLFPVCMQSVVAELKLGLDCPKLSTHQDASTLESHDYLVQLVA